MCPQNNQYAHLARITLIQFADYGWRSFTEQNGISKDTFPRCRFESSPSNELLTKEFLDFKMKYLKSQNSAVEAWRKQIIGINLSREIQKGTFEEIQ